MNSLVLVKCGDLFANVCMKMTLDEGHYYCYNYFLL